MKKLEQIEQKKFIKYLQLKNIFHFAIKNESGTSFGNAGKFIGSNDKSMGKLKGVSDLVVMLDDKILFIEMKRCRTPLKRGGVDKKKILKDEQKAFLEKVNTFPYARGFVAYGCDEAIEIVENQM